MPLQIFPSNNHHLSVKSDNAARRARMWKRDTTKGPGSYSMALNDVYQKNNIGRGKETCWWSRLWRWKCGKLADVKFDTQQCCCSKFCCEFLSSSSQPAESVFCLSELCMKSICFCVVNSTPTNYLVRAEWISLVEWMERKKFSDFIQLARKSFNPHQQRERKEISIVMITNKSHHHPEKTI